MYIRIYKHMGYKIMKIKYLLSVMIFASLSLSHAYGGELTKINPALIYWKEFLILSDHSNINEIESNYEKEHIDDEYRRVANSFDDLFLHLERASSASAFCEWGNDFNEGPFLLLPHLIHSKRVAQIARLRARMHVSGSKSGLAIQEILSALRLSRHVSQEPTLVNTLVAYALNGICMQAIAENFYGYSNDDLQALSIGIESLPPAGKIESVVETERKFMVGWLASRIKSISKENRGNQEESSRKILDLLMTITTGDEAFRKLIQNQSVDETIKMINAVLPYYEAVPELFKQSPTASVESLTKHVEKVTKHSSPFLKEFYPDWTKTRVKQIGNQVRLQMMKAAIAYKLQGMNGFRMHKDPNTNAPFEFEKFLDDGKERGFIIISRESPDMVTRKQAFVEKKGPRLKLFGDKLGEPKP